jgi:hypothetical protein
MGDVAKQLVSSKRFVVVTLTLLICAAFVVAGRMPVDHFLDTLKVLGGLLAALYGVENAAQALRPAPPPITKLRLEDLPR